MKECSVVKVMLKSQERFEVLRCERDKYIVKGPILDPRVEEEERTMAVDAKDVILPTNGVPGICHGSNNAAYLNGKIGHIRSYEVTAERYAVHFDDSKTIPPKSEKLENLRILFDIPN
ncbi:hypothetical protein ACHAWO_005507 [Cyclotella atomus]|jgi:hypothetical protein|uniref:Uncharacterized protein n=1 Tax=Cyclotella atomus TaxID=382360 RepID=A0ABD3QAD7_9STRA